MGGGGHSVLNGILPFCLSPIKYCEAGKKIVILEPLLPIFAGDSFDNVPSFLGRGVAGWNSGTARVQGALLLPVVVKTRT